VDTKIQRSDRANRAAEFLADAPDALDPGEKRFTAVQNHRDGIEPLRLRVLGQAPRDLPYRRLADDAGTGGPALVGVLVDVAVIAREIAPAVDL
jgi:hypothetical protein